MNQKQKNYSRFGYLLFLMLIVVSFTSCTSIIKMGLGDGEEFSFDNKELEVKMTFYCTNVKKGENVRLRARKAFDYFNKENNQNIEILTDKMFKKEISPLEFSNDLDQLSKKLTDDTTMKFNCSLIDVVDY